MAGEGHISGSSCLVENQQRSDLQIRYGSHTTLAADDTVASGLNVVLCVTAVLESDLTLDPAHVTAVASTGGDMLLKTWKGTSTSNPTPIAAETFTKVVNWIAVGY